MNLTITCEKRSATKACIGNSSSVATGISSLKNMNAITARHEQYSSARLLLFTASACTHAHRQMLKT
eukprot:11283-Heterococcus_DN1.PRE.1